MGNESTLTLTTLPQESLQALERAAAQRFKSRILTGGKNDQPRFVIEKQVRYDFMRGWSTYALYQIIGSFQETQRGETTLKYVVSGQSVIPLLHAALHIGLLLVMTLLLGTFLFGAARAGNWIAILLLGVLLLTMIGYGWFAYRSYQGHLRELNDFMEEFAQRMGNASD